MRKLGITIVSLLVLAACGGGEEASSSETTTTTVAVADSTATTEWADMVGGVLDNLIAAQRESTNAFVAVFEPGPAEVTAIRDLFQSDAASLADAVAALPPPPDDPALAVPYDAFVTALGAESDTASDIATELTSDHDALRAEVEANGGDSDGTRYGQLRGLFGPVVGARTDACFSVQAAFESAGLESINCIDDEPLG